MANPFMPSVATSLSQAGGDALEQMLRQRAFEQQMQMQQLQMLGQMDQREQMNQFRVASQLRADEALRHRQGQDAERLRRQQAQDEAKAKKDAEEARAKLNEQNAAGMAFEGLTRGEDPESPAMRRTMFEGRVPVSLMPKKEVPFDQQLQQIEQKAAASARGRRQGAPPIGRATKPAKDDPKIPAGVKAAIDAKRGQPGWENAQSAAQSFMKAWPSFRSAHPNLDQAKVRAYIANAYGQRLTPTTVAGESDPGDDILDPQVVAALVQMGRNRAKK